MRANRTIPMTDFASRHVPRTLPLLSFSSVRRRRFHREACPIFDVFPQRWFYGRKTRILGMTPAEIP